MSSADPTAPPRPTLQRPPGYRESGPTKLPVRRPPLKPPVRRRRRRSLRCRIVCCILLTIFTLVFIAAIASALAYLYFQPRLPSFRIQSLNVTTFNVTTHADGSGTFFTAFATVKIFAYNANGKLDLRYGDGEVRMYVEDVEMDIAMDAERFGGFFQGRKNATVMKFGAGVKGLLVDDVVGGRLRNGFKSGDMRIGVEVRTGVGTKVRGVKVRKVPVRIKCRPVSLRMAKGRKDLPKCDVYLFRWINLH